MTANTVSLPAPRTEQGYPLERALRERRSIRSFSSAPIDLEDISQLVWAAQGVTDGHGLRTAPSAGALYPLELYLIGGRVRALEPGVYRFKSSMHELMLITHEDKRQALTCAAHSQESIGAAAAVFLLSAVERRTGQKYGSRAARYVHMEAGHAAQNLLLQAAALELGAVVIGAFDDAAVGSVMNLPPGEEPLYLIPVGRR